VLAAALGGRQLPRPEQLNVARRTLAFSLRGWHGSRGRQHDLFVHYGGEALGDRIAAPLGERREASQAARKNRNLVCATLRFAHLASSSVSWLTWASRSGSSCRNADELAAVRVGNPFLAAPGKFTVAIFLDGQPSACQHLALFRSVGTLRRCRLLGVIWTEYAHYETFSS
jgi:hypothetical protein